MSNMDFTNTFLSQITLGRQFNAYESINYTGHWCEFCGEDNGGGKFCYACGKREVAEEKEEEEGSGIFYNGCEIDSIYCENCKTFPPLVKTSFWGAELNTCECKIINNIYLETKGNILVKTLKMYEERDERDKELFGLIKSLRRGQQEESEEEEEDSEEEEEDSEEEEEEEEEIPCYERGAKGLGHPYYDMPFKTCEGDSECCLKRFDIRTDKYVVEEEEDLMYCMVCAKDLLDEGKTIKYENRTNQEEEEEEDSEEEEEEEEEDCDDNVFWLISNQ